MNRSRASSCLLFTCLLLLRPGDASSQGPPSAVSARGMAIVQNAGYPELRVDGEPFFIHSAAFFYYRTPRDLWESSLDRHKDLGINTIDLYIPWNWHEPREGEFDFEGRSHPRRDLRALLRMIAEKGFRLIARPGPVILNEWRHGGYPEWLLERPEYQMDARDRLEGRYTPLSNRNARDAEGAAQGWLDNATHMAYAEKWLRRVAQELQPYSARRTLTVPNPGAEKNEPKEKIISGPLLFVQLDDDMAIGRTNYAGPAFWRYMGELRRMLEVGGIDVPFYINPTDMRVSAAGFGLERPIGAMGQWYLSPPPTPPAGSMETPGPRHITAQDAATIEFFVETLKTQPAFPPVIIEYQAAWYSPGEDARPQESSPSNTLLSSRLLLAHGAHGWNYFPAQDTVTPAGYTTPWTNRYYRWDAALDPNANAQPRARAVERNGQLMELWASLLAASHKRADFGIVYPLGAYTQETLAREDIQNVSRTAMRLQRLALLAGMTSELLDPQYQPVEQMLRHAVILLPVDDPAQEKFHLSEKAQRVLADYVRRGGTLACFPAYPPGKIFEELRSQAARAAAGGEPGAMVRTIDQLGKGRLLEVPSDFYSWINTGEDPAQNRAHPEASTAIQVLTEFLTRAGVQRLIYRAKRAPLDQLVVTQLVSNDGTGLLGARTAGRGLLSVTNLNPTDPAEDTLEMVSPRESGHNAKSERIALPVQVPAGESLLLPLHFPLCSAVREGRTCTDEVVASGAELLRVERDGKALELTFYTPTRSTVRLKLERPPSRVRMQEISVEGRWTVGKNEFEFDVLRGAAPDYLRVVRVQLPYTPHVTEKPDANKTRRRDYDYGVSDALRLPLARDASLVSYPPLILLDQDLTGQVIVEAKNYDELGRNLDIKVEGPIRASAGLGLDADELGFERVDLKPSRNGSNGEASVEGVLRGRLTVRAGRDERSQPIAFVSISKDAPTPYQFDFDRDAANEWVLEDPSLRLIVSPEDGGRALALVEKESGQNLTTSVGLLRDHFAYAESASGTRPERARGRAGLFNRAYRARWVQEEKNTALELEYSAPDVYPAGATLRKTVRLAEPGKVRVDYEVALNPSAAADAAAATQAFVAVNSVAVRERSERSTDFCWKKTAAESEAPECRAFVPGGETLAVPEGVTILEVRTPGGKTLALEWQHGAMIIEMKRYSALLRLQFPSLTPGGPKQSWSVLYTVKTPE